MGQTPTPRPNHPTNTATDGPPPFPSFPYLLADAVDRLAGVHHARQRFEQPRGPQVGARRVERLEALLLLLLLELAVGLLLLSVGGGG